VFDVVYVMTGGGPGTATETVAMYTFSTLLQHLRFGYGSALSVIVFAGPLGLTELADAQQVRPPTMTRIVSALEQAGLVEKRRSGRTVSLSATGAGHALLERARRRRLGVLAERLRKLAPDEVATVAEAAGLIERALHSS
jgi:DNA-binding MarR family transcriptional regulator